MIVDFYQIGNCKYEFYRGRHVIFAPNNTNEGLLYTYRFFRAEDGRACHFLTPDEYIHVMNCMNAGRAVFGMGNQMPIRRAEGEMISEQEPKNVIALCFISLILLLASFALVSDFEEYTIPCFIASFVTAIVARSINKKSIFALVLIIIHAVIAVLFIIAIVMVMIACGAAIESFIDSFN